MSERSLLCCGVCVRTRRTTSPFRELSLQIAVCSSFFSANIRGSEGEGFVIFCLTDAKGSVEHGYRMHVNHVPAHECFFSQPSAANQIRGKYSHERLPACMRVSFRIFSVSDFTPSSAFTEAQIKSRDHDKANEIENW